MLAIILCAALAIAVLAPETPLGRALRETLVDAPARRMAGMRRSHWIAAACALGALLLLVAYLKTAGLQLFASAAPEALSWFTLFDIVTYLDALTLVALLAASRRLRAVYLVARAAILQVRAWVSRMSAGRQGCERRRASRRRGGRPRRRKTPRTDDNGWAPAVWPA